MKPHPDVLRRALVWLDVTPNRAVLIGDSTADIDAARALGTVSVGYANRAAKSDSYHHLTSTRSSVDALTNFPRETTGAREPIS